MQLDLVGLRDIATMLGVAPRTPGIWRMRGVLPPEDGYISDKFPVWHRQTIQEWATKTGRVRG